MPFTISFVSTKVTLIQIGLTIAVPIGVPVFENYLHVKAPLKHFVCYFQASKVQIVLRRVLSLFIHEVGLECFREPHE